MIELKQKDLEKIKGGASKIGVFAGIVAGVVFAIGILDGLVRPLRCN